MFEFLKFWKKKEPVAKAVPASVPEMPARARTQEPVAPPERPPSMFSQEQSNRPAVPNMPGEEHGMPSAGLGPEQATGFKRTMRRLEVPQPPEIQADIDSNKDIQLINAKLDAIKAGIDHINARLDRLDKPKEEREIIAWR